MIQSVRMAVLDKYYKHVLSKLNNLLKHNRYLSLFYRADDVRKLQI